VEDPKETGASVPDARGKAFTELASRRQAGGVRQYLEFVRYHRKWWLLPVLGVLIPIGIFILLSVTPAAPFIYALF
jgi:hypothetical protein